MSLIKNSESSPYRTLGKAQTARERSFEDVIETVREKVSRIMPVWS